MNYHENSTSVLGLDVAKHRQVRVLGPDVDTTTPPQKHHKNNTKTPPQNRLQFLGRMLRNTEKYENYHETRLQFLGRMLRNTEKYENYHENSTSVLGPDVAAPKTSRKHEFYCKNPVKEYCRRPKSTRITTKNEHRRS